MANQRTEFDFRSVGDGRTSVVRYANNSQYRNDSLIRKESKLCLTDTLTLI
jgi:protein mago nashi